MISIPEIPTYQIRFAIEEGTWVVLFRDIIRNLMKDEFKRLIALEDLIWDTEKATAPDLAYYLLELMQIGEKWVKSIYNIWKRHHDYGEFTIFAFILISSYHQTNIRRGQLMFQGGQRLLQAKLNILEQLETFNDPSPWCMNAKNLLAEIKEHEDNNNPLIVTTITTLSLLQRDLAQSKQQKEDDIQSIKVLNKTIDWKNFDPSNLEQRERFSEQIVTSLYRRTETDVLEAALNLLTEFLEGVNVSKSIIKIYQEKLINNLRNERPENLIDLIQKNLPTLLLEIKAKEIKESKATSLRGSNKDLELWNVLFDNLHRSKRISEQDLAKNIVVKAVKVVYQKLIGLRMTPLIAAKELIFNFVNEFRQEDKQLELENQIQSITEDPQYQGVSLSIIDEEIINTLSLRILELIKSA